MKEIELDNLLQIEDKYESLYVFIVYEKTVKILINYLFEYFSNFCVL